MVQVSNEPKHDIPIPKVLVVEIAQVSSWPESPSLVFAAVIASNPHGREGPTDFECPPRHCIFNNFKHLGVQDAAKRDISCPKTAT